MEIQRYHSGFKDLWNTCNAQAVNGTFLFDRTFMEYHESQFTDHSLLFFRQHKLIALLPLHEAEEVVASHNGLSFGGFIMTPAVDTNRMLQLFENLKIYLTQHKFRSLIYKPQPYVYFMQPTQDDLFGLYQQNARITQRVIVSVLDITLPPLYFKLRQRCLRRAKTQNLRVKQSEDVASYMQLVADLYRKAGIKPPTHTTIEMQYLLQTFPENIKLLVAYSGQELVGGVLLFIHPQVVNLQYMATSELGKQKHALDLLIDTVITTYQNKKKYLSFGSSQDSREPYHTNFNLLRNKGSYGARGVVQDTYQIHF
ncbi:GNAT family N-acetyltransferase [Adhaeribacter pallidiroseus]|uniref:BioF2-like acetyltransferase domain-containing protein n=1 Tax=Adhaeribacter pallidiroseus TaxID=2072847 RepID=A0A369QF48_9BACT|nr:GNAT family N-acetyltransferase [Adhaeribacter pallidiroseus]RDC63531.1 hypothetical protein AHMF7616_02136 [Adhaeribacter pallidiroseus]